MKYFKENEEDLEKKSFITRRNFSKSLGVYGLSLAGAASLLNIKSASGAGLGRKVDDKNNKNASVKSFLEEATLKRESVDRFFDPEALEWAFFDPELGYRLRNSVVRDGLDKSLSFANYEKTGERRQINYSGKPCRINTYGNSFTQCHQVSNGETWQEYLAAHIGEPIRNYGIGGYGVFQAYRRMLREEKTDSAAEYIILNIWDDDHYRSTSKWQWLRLQYFRKLFVENYGKRLIDWGAPLFHANPWSYVRVDPDTGKVKEYDNTFITKESIYRLCDKDFVYHEFKRDFVVQVLVAQKTGKFEYVDDAQKLCKQFNIKGDLNNPEDCRRIAAELDLVCSLKASMYIVEKATDFANKMNKKLMIMLSFSQENVIKACKGQPRFDQLFVDYLNKEKILFVDTLQDHVVDYQSFRITPEEYVKRYYIGHYAPQGNHFFAYAVKDAIVNWLNPKPPAYL